MPDQNETEMMGGETMEDHRNPRRRRNQPPASESPVGIVVQTEPKHALDRLILHRNVRADIESAIHAVEIRDQLESVWRMSEVQQHTGRCILNFYGPPGTGKTRAALGIAHRLGKPLYQVDYSAIVSKYLGDTAKHIVAAFRDASEAGAVLFFDEADSLLSRRVAPGESCSTSINQNRNTLMQELDRFAGVVVMTTNLFGNYDEAILRRVARHVQFKLPDASMREKILRLHLPALDRTPADLNAVAVMARGLSGGDILNVCVNAMHAASVDPDPALWRVTEDLLVAEVVKVLAAKDAHSARATKAKPETNGTRTVNMNGSH